MKFLVSLWLFLTTCLVSAQTIDYVTVSGSEPSEVWEDFKWTWQNQDSRNFVASFTNETGLDNVLFRLSWPERGPYYLSVENGLLTPGGGGTVFQLPNPIEGSNVPPVRIYFAEFLGVYASGAQRTLAKGRVDVKWSLFAGTNAGSFTPIEITYGDNTSTVSDNLGNHIATQNLNMNNFSIENVADNSITFQSGQFVSSQSVIDWNTAFGWGDHATAGYLTSFTETDPVFAASDVADVTNTDQLNWDTAFGWGDHAAEGYLTTFTETDPVWQAASGSYYTKTEADSLFATGTPVYTETDPVFSASPAGSIAPTDVSNWNTAYGWGDHSVEGYLTTETDPVFSSSDVADITNADQANWDTAYGWGDHSAQGYYTVLTLPPETDPIYSGSDVADITDTDQLNWDIAFGWGDHGAVGYITSESDPIFSNSDVADITNLDQSNWDTAYGWGDHAGAGYLVTETDPVFAASVAAGVTITDTSNWSEAYGWGDHSTEGYLTTYTETDPVFAASDAFGITLADQTNWDAAFGWGDHSVQGYLTSFTETDPVFGASDVADITDTDQANWDTAFGWGDHAGAGYLTSFSETDPTVPVEVKAITSTDTNNWTTAFGWGDHAGAGYLTSFTETDPVFSTSVANNITPTDTNNWTTAYNWGDHAGAGYLTSFTETDPVFTASVANDITVTDTNNWTTAFEWGDHAGAGYLTSFTEVNDLTANVTWATVPTQFISEASITQHQAAITITESQISDLFHPPGADNLGDHTATTDLQMQNNYISTVVFNPCAVITVTGAGFGGVDQVYTYAGTLTWVQGNLCPDPLAEYEVPYYTNAVNDNVIAAWSDTEDFGWGIYPTLADANTFQTFNAYYGTISASPCWDPNNPGCPSDDTWFPVNAPPLTSPTVLSAGANVPRQVISPFMTTLIGGWEIDTDAVAGKDIVNYDVLTNKIAELSSGIETDPVFTASDVADITNTDQANWDAAFGWGDHALAGYLTSYTETDPVFTASVANNITVADTNSWTTAFGWGDHALAGYLTSFTETDPTVPAEVKAITSTDTNNWTTAFGWGDHGAEGYLTSFTETDPTVPVEVKAITSTDTNNWTTAFGWGDHAAEGYLTSFTETDPVFTASVANNITVSDTNNWTTAFSWGDHALAGYLTSYTETDPVFTASVASGITVTDTSNWTTAFGWGDHATAGYTLNADTSLVGNGYFLDEDDMVSDDPTKVPSQQSVKAYVDAEVSTVAARIGFKVNAGDPTPVPDIWAIPNDSSFEKLTFLTNEVYDTTNLWNPATQEFTPDRNGVWLIGGKIRAASAINNGAELRFSIINATTLTEVARIGAIIGTSASGVMILADEPLVLTAGQSYFPAVWEDSSGSEDVSLDPILLGVWGELLEELP